MAGIWADTKKIEELYLKHTDIVEKCLKVFAKTIKLYIEKGECPEVEQLNLEVHKLESSADDIRREIIKLMIEEGFLLPNTRRDFLQLLELVDKVADYAEAALDYVLLQSMDISGIGRDNIKEIMMISINQFQLLREAIMLLFNNITKAFDLVLEIDRLESEVDGIERLLIRRLSRRKDLDYCLKVFYKDFITMIANISDVIEDAGDEIEVIIAMRKI